MSSNPAARPLMTLKDDIEIVIGAGRVPYLAGSPGLGKSDLIRKIAKEYNLFLIDLRLSTLETVDLSGFPAVDISANLARYVPMETFPLETTELPKGYDGWLLFLDELTHADVPVQKSAFQLILDHCVGQYRLNSRCAVVAAGNLLTDNSAVIEMPTALRSRMIHFEVKADLEQWLDWAYDFGIDQRITSFVKFDPSSLYTFDPETDDTTYACPRTWQFLHDFIGENRIPDFSTRDYLPLVSGTVSLGVANQFLAFVAVYKDLVNIDQILANPTSARIPDRPDVQYALSGMISSYFNNSNSNKLITYLKRLPTEMQAKTIKEIRTRDPLMQSNPDLIQWLTDSAHKFYGT